MYDSSAYEEAEQPRSLIVIEKPFAYDRRRAKRRVHGAGAPTGDDQSVQDAANELVQKLAVAFEANAVLHAKGRQAYDPTVIVDIREHNPEQMELFRKLAPPACTICADDNPNNVADVRLPCKHWYHRACLEERSKHRCKVKVCRAKFKDSELQPALVQFKAMAASDFCVTLNCKVVSAAERKTISDLISSIYSGHLKKQTSNYLLFPEFAGDRHRYAFLLELDGDQLLYSWLGAHAADRSTVIGALVNRDLDGFSTKIMPSSVDTVYWLFKSMLRLASHGKELWPKYADQPDFDASNMEARAEALPGRDKRRLLAAREMPKIKAEDVPTDVPLSSTNYVRQLLAIPRITPEYAFVIVRRYPTPADLFRYLESQRENPQELLDTWSVLTPPELNAKPMGPSRVCNIYNHYFAPQSLLCAKKKGKTKITYEFVAADAACAADAQDDDADAE